MTHVRFMVLCPGGFPRAGQPAAENQPCSIGSVKPLLIGSPIRGHRTKNAVLTFPTVPGRITTGNCFPLTRANHRVKHAADNAWPKVLAASIGLKEHIGTRLVSFQSICQNRVDCLCRTTPGSCIFRPGACKNPWPRVSSLLQVQVGSLLIG